MDNPFKKIPRISGLQHIKTLSLDLPSRLTHFAEMYGDIVQLLKRPRSYLITDPECIEHILKKNVDNYSKQLRDYHRLGKLLGRGLLTTMGPSWLQRRRLLQTLFHADSLEVLAEHTQVLTQHMLERWEYFARHQEPVDVTQELLALVLQISMKFFFSEALSHTVALQLVKKFSVSQRCMMQALTLHPRVPTPNNIRFRLVRQAILKKTQDMVWQRRQLPETQWPQDLLTLLLRARDSETQLPFSNEMILDEVVTFMATGHETTGNALSWTLYCLAHSSESTAQLQHELSVQLGDALPRAVDIPQLSYTRMVFQESLRLYPTIWATARRAEHDDLWRDFSIAKHSLLVISPYVMHRLSKYWHHPHAFMPERMCEHYLQQMPRYVYLPFGAGPHVCIAQQFSLLKGQLILASILQRFQLTLLPESRNMPLEPLISLRPMKPMRFLITQR